jgi:uncharacterized protein YdhG (YjbR/CyaY superfamily)
MPRSTTKTEKRTTTTRKSSAAFTDEERSAMKNRAQEVKSARGGASPEDDAKAVLAKIAELSASDREMAEAIHAVVVSAAPELAPRLWYGMPAYAKGGKVVCFFQPAMKFKARYATLGFNDPANLDNGSMWPTAYALIRVTAAEEKKIAALVKRAAS